jgi:hypothetical protein
MPLVEIREIPGLPGYGVDRDGGVWTRRLRGPARGRTEASLPWKRLVTRRDHGGYMRAVAWYGAIPRLILVHRAVLGAFVGPCPVGMEARHLNGEGADNRLINLTWGTKKENASDRKSHGGYSRGTECPSARLTEDQVLSIRRRYAAGESTMLGMAREYGVAHATVAKVVHRKTWLHLRDQVSP